MRVIPTPTIIQKQQGGQMQAPNGQLQMLPLFMRGPLAVPDTSVVTEEATYLSNIAKL